MKEEDFQIFPGKVLFRSHVLLRKNTFSFSFLVPGGKKNSCLTLMISDTVPFSDLLTCIHANVRIGITDSIIYVSQLLANVILISIMSFFYGF